MKLVILFLILILAIDGIFREGILVSEFFSQDFNMPIVIKIIFALIAFVTTILLLHSIIYEYQLLPRPKHKKTSFELEKEHEDELQKKELKKITNFNKNKKLQDQKTKSIPPEPIKKKSKLS